MTWQEFISALRLDLLWALLLAVILGGAIGLEREIRGKAAGLRTNILICVGATLFTQLSMYLAGTSGDPSRIAAQIVTGVGFIGAGTILRDRGALTGLTSAATIWLVAAIGIAIGAGWILEAAGVTLLVLLVLGCLGRLEPYLQGQAKVTRCSVKVADPDSVDELERLIQQAGAAVDEILTETRGPRTVLNFAISGSKAARDRAKLALLRKTGSYKVSAEE
ncbi:MAG: MgtC/SapB family protein [Gemmatimonadales bacterium]